MKYYDYVVDVVKGKDGSMIVNGKYITLAEAEAIYRTIEEAKEVCGAAEEK